ncbi:MAG: hypothetical protein RBS07_07155 [Lentimicrobium sp.]|jgi:hypothetical protein|nr:hypothetical protein [Lentimicrobium sp.]
MKKAMPILMTTLLLLFFIPFQLTAAEDNDPGKASVTADAQSARVNVLVDRLYEINDMDIPAMSFTEKKALRKEVRSIKRELESISDNASNPPVNVPPLPPPAQGIYLSAGAVIIIVLLLILLL